MQRRIVGFVLGIFFVVICARKFARGFAQADFATPIDRIFAPLAREKTPGVAVLVRREGRTIFERGYGVRELRTLAKIDVGTIGTRLQTARARNLFLKVLREVRAQFQFSLVG